VALEAAPLLPLERACAKEEDDRDGDEDDEADLGNFDEVLAKVVHDGRVELVAEDDGVLLRDGQRLFVEGEAGEGVIDVLLEQLKRRVEAGCVCEYVQVSTWQGSD
jgi:hypothetical protein